MNCVLALGLALKIGLGSQRGVAWVPSRNRERSHPFGIQGEPGPLHPTCAGLGGNTTRCWTWGFGGGGTQASAGPGAVGLPEGEIPGVRVGTHRTPRSSPESRKPWGSRGTGWGARSPGPLPGTGPRILSLRLPRGAWKERREAGTKVRSWRGAADALRGPLSPGVPRPVRPLHALPEPLPVPGAAAGARGQGRAAGSSEAPRPRPAPSAARPPRLAPRPLARSPLPPPRRAPRSAAAAPPTLRPRASGTAPPAASSRAAAGRAGRAPTMRGRLWLLVLVLRGAARALSPQPGAGRTGGAGRGHGQVPTGW